MKKSNLAVAILLVVILALAGCGSNSHVVGNINGNWAATLSSTGPDTFAFNTLLTVHGDGSLGSSNFTFTVNNTQCFPSTTGETGSFTLQGNFNGQMSGSFQYTITGAEGNILSLNGTVQNGQITGTWTLSGAIGCSGNGNFTMIPARLERTKPAFLRFALRGWSSMGCSSPVTPWRVCIGQTASAFSKCSQRVVSTM